MTDYPKYYYIELTQNCNLYCTMCRPHIMTSKEWFMPDQLLEKACDIADCYAEVVDLRGWGESSLDDRLQNTAIHFKKRGILTRLYTNLNARDNDYWRELAGTDICLAISIESGTEQEYSSLRRGGKLSILEEHLTSFLAGWNSKDPELQPYFTVVISENNLNSLNSIVKLAAKHGIRHIELNPISLGDKSAASGRRTGLRECDKSYAIEMLKKMQEEAEKELVSIEVAANLFNENDINRRICIHPWKYCCICIDGSVTFCDHLLHHKGAVMGNLNENSFDEIWNGYLYQRLRSDLLNGDYSELNKRHIECEWCSQNRYGNSEYLVGESDLRAINLKNYLEKYK